MQNLHFETKRLIIRPYQKNDYTSWRQAYGLMKPAQNKWDINPRPENELTRVHFQNLLNFQKEQRSKGTFLDMAVFLKDSGEIIGCIDWMDISRGVFQNCYLGYRIFNRHWGKGYGKEMVTAAIKIAFQDLKLHRIEAGIDPKNRRSILLARSIGMRKEGLKKRALFIRDGWQDLVVYALTCEDVGMKFRGDFKALAARMR